MIEKSTVNQIVEEWLKKKSYFLADLVITPDSRILVEIDHAQGVWIEDCVELSRFIESKLDREKEDFELEVGSAGIGQPFKVLRQYEIHLGHEVEVLTKEGKKLQGTLKEVTPEHFILSTIQKIKEEGAKRPKPTLVDITFGYNEIKYTKYVISFK
ncbi:MAG: ribosome assembly cofactor RimP [Bacteroidaceae bacterium]